MNKTSLKARLLSAVVCALLLPLNAAAQKDDLRNLYNQASNDYDLGRIEQAEKILAGNISSFPAELLPNVYRLLSLCCLATDREREAQNYVELLLNENPYYSSTINDTPRFTDMVESVKAGRVGTITTASSQLETLSEVPVPTTLITEEMIRNSGARNLQEVLAAYVPSMHIVDCNDDINIAMRGIYSNGQEKILIMLNGHRLNSFCTNIAAPDFSLSLDKLRQIEVLRGPASSLYGGVALTAVVNLITKQGADVDGLEAKGSVGSYGQWRGNLLLGKRYFDLDLLVWGNLYTAKGQNVYMPLEDTGLKLSDGDITIGGIGNKPTYDMGMSAKYKNLQFLYNTHFSQIVSPMSTFYTFSPYDIDKYKTYNGIRPSFATNSHHLDLSYALQAGRVNLKGTVAYDNSDLTHYQAIDEFGSEIMLRLMPLPDDYLSVFKGAKGISRYINGQEHTYQGKLQGDYTYTGSSHAKGTLSFGTEYSYFRLNDVRYAFSYNYIKTMPENEKLAELGKGHESNINAFLQVKQQWHDFIVNAGLRYDYKNRYDDTKIKEFSPRLALIYTRPTWNLKLSYSKAFIDAPYLYRKSNLFLYLYAGFDSILASDLQPEAFHSYQFTFAALQWIKYLNFELNAFYNRARDLIFVRLVEHENSGNFDSYGLELTTAYEYRRFKAHVAASWQTTSKAEIFTKSFDKPLNTPAVAVNAVMAWRPTARLNLHTHIDFAGKQHTYYLDIFKYSHTLELITKQAQMATENYDNPGTHTAKEMQDIQREIDGIEQFNDVSIPARVVFNLGADYALGRFTLGFNVHNLFNKRYYRSGMSTGLMPQKGRWMLFDVAYKF